MASAEQCHSHGTDSDTQWAFWEVSRNKQKSGCLSVFMALRLREGHESEVISNEESLPPASALLLGGVGRCPVAGGRSIHASTYALLLRTLSSLLLLGKISIVCLTAAIKTQRCLWQ